MCAVPRQGPCPSKTTAKVQKVWESAKKVEEKFEGNGKMLIQLSQVGLSIKKEVPVVQSKKTFRWLHC